MTTKIDEMLGEWLDEANELRFEYLAGDQTDTLTEIHSKLIAVRGNLDRLEQIVIHLVKLNGEVKQGVADMKANLDDAWDHAATRKNVGFSFDGPAPRERYAEYNQRTLHETVDMRQAERVERKVYTALEVVRIMHRGLDSVRRDLETRIRLISLESSLGG